MMNNFFSVSGHSQHYLGHIVPGSALIVLALLPFWNDPWGVQWVKHNQRNIFSSNLSGGLVVLMIIPWILELINDPVNLHNQHHFLMYVGFEMFFVADLAGARGKIFPGASTIVLSLAYANEGVLFMGHQVNGIAEAKMHEMTHCLAFGSALTALLGLWSGSGWAISATFYCSALQGTIIFAMGVWLDSFRDEHGNRVWGPLDEHENHHKYMMQVHMLLSVTAMVWMALWIYRLSATHNASPHGNRQDEQVVEDGKDEKFHLYHGKRHAEQVVEDGEDEQFALS